MLHTSTFLNKKKHKKKAETKIVPFWKVASFLGFKFNPFFSYPPTIPRVPGRCDKICAANPIARGARGATPGGN